MSSISSCVFPWKRNSEKSGIDCSSTIYAGARDMREIITMVQRKMIAEMNIGDLSLIIFMAIYIIRNAARPINADLTREKIIKYIDTNSAAKIVGLAEVWRINTINTNRESIPAKPMFPAKETRP